MVLTLNLGEIIRIYLVALVSKMAWDNVVGMSLQDEIQNCRICADQFAATHTKHAPRPVVWFRPSARILIAGQAPGMRVHQSGRPFTDPSGDRLRDWLGIDETCFYDTSRIAIVPMAFCYLMSKLSKHLNPIFVVKY